MADDTPFLRLRPNLVFSGQAATARIEWLPATCVGQRCTLELVELDEVKQADGTTTREVAPGEAGVVATFAVDVVEAPQGEVGLRFANAERAAGEEAALPGPDADGITWQVPHLLLTLEGCEGEHVVIVDVAETRERAGAEGMVYELALRLTGPDGVVVHPAPGQSLPFVQLCCDEVIAHNAAEAAKRMLKLHQARLKSRGYSEYYGSKTQYAQRLASPDDADGHGRCHVCALRADDESAYPPRTPAPKSKKAEHARQPSSLTMTDCTMYVLQCLYEGFTKGRASADAADQRARRAGRGSLSGIDIGHGLSEIGWVVLYFDPSGEDPKGRVADIEKDGRVTDDHANTARKPRIPVEAVVRGHSDPDHPDNERYNAKFEALRKMPFVIYNPASQVHMLMGIGDDLYESHWGSSPRNEGLIECTDTVMNRFGAERDGFFAIMPRSFYVQHLALVDHPELDPLKIEWPEATKPVRAG